MQRIDQATQEALARADVTINRATALTLEHSTFPEDFKFVEYDVDLTVDGEVYKAATLGVGSTPQNGEPGSTVAIIVDGIASTVPFYVTQALRGLEVIKADIKYFIIDTENNVAESSYLTLPLEVQAASAASNNSLTLTMGFLTAANKAFPNRYYNAIDFPQLYR